MSRIGAIVRWSAWAGSLSSRHRRLAVRIAGLISVLAKPRAAGRAVRELRTHSTRTLRPQIHLAIQPLLRFELRPAATTSTTVTTATVPQLLRQALHETGRMSSSISGMQRAAPLALVLQRLREPGLVVRPERGLVIGPAERPALARRLAGKVRREERPIAVPSVRVLKEKEIVVDRPHAVPDPWREASTGVASSTAPSVSSVSQASVEALTEKVMQQMDRRLHAWRERRGGF